MPGDARLGSWQSTDLLGAGPHTEGKRHQLIFQDRRIVRGVVNDSAHIDYVSNRMLGAQ